MTPQPPGNEPEPAFGEAEPAAEEQYQPDEVWSTVPPSRASTVDTAEEEGRRRKFMILGIAGGSLVLLIVAVILGVGWLGDASQRSQFQGDWVDQARNPYTIQGDRLLKNQEELGTFSIDATTEPKSIDMTYSSGEYKGQTLKGIYDVSGNRLSIYLSYPGQERPRNFERPPTRILFALTRPAK